MTGDITSVSYTHLDVYKRQAPGRYILEAFTENSIAGLGTDTQTMTSLGTVEILIDEDNAALEVMAVNASCTNEGWTYGKDYTIENIKVRGDSASDGGYRSVQAGEAAGSGCLLYTSRCV